MTGRTTAGKASEGTFCLVLHSHLPWLAHHGAWPVGEEWLYQAWAHSYLPVVDMLRRFADEGRSDVLTLGVTPILAAQLDDPYSLRGAHDWLGNWHLRSHYAGERLRELSAYEHRASSWALDQFETHWRHGFSPILRSLVDSSTIELLGGPATHPFQPLLVPRVRSFALRTGLDDTALRVGKAPEGIWAPECGYSPGMEAGYAAAGVRRFMVDGPALHGDTSSAHPVGSSDVLAFGRDLEVSYRVWSPKVGYPGDAAYRDFHTYDHPTGLKPSRVTGKNIAPEDKRPYDPLLAREAVSRHVDDFVETVVRRLRAIDGGLVVAAYDTELYGHWWHEGPLWLEGVLRALPEAGVHVTTLRGAVEAGHVGAPVELPASSWGSGKDWRVWDGAQVSDIVSLNESVQKELLDLDFSSDVRDPVLDQAVREALLALSSDWAFMVTKDSAADYARYRAKIHSDRFSELAALVRGGRGHARAAELRAADGPFGHLDARGMR